MMMLVPGTARRSTVAITFLSAVWRRLQPRRADFEHPPKQWEGMLGVQLVGESKTQGEADPELAVIEDAVRVRGASLHPDAGLGLPTLLELGPSTTAFLCVGE